MGGVTPHCLLPAAAIMCQRPECWFRAFFCNMSTGTREGFDSATGLPGVKLEVVFQAMSQVRMQIGEESNF